MNYELAKRLKDAGFPHNWCSEDDCSCLTNGDSKKGTMCFPTLSELIEACGDRFGSLVRGDVDGDGYWWAVEGDKYPRILKTITGIEARADPRSRKGPTPKEAVANLWLALKGK